MQFTTNSDSKQLTADQPCRQLKTKRARCESAAVRTKKLGLEAVSLIKKRITVSHVKTHIKFNNSYGRGGGLKIENLGKWK